MTDERYKQLMAQVGAPNSTSLLGVLQQVANEVAQDWDKKVKRLEGELAYNNALWEHLELLSSIHVTESPAWLLNFSDGTNGHANTFMAAVAEALQRATIMKMNPDFDAAVRAEKGVRP